MNSEGVCPVPMFIIARNPTPGTRLPYLLCLPVTGEEPLILATADIWPSGRDLFCHPMESWPEQPETLEIVPVQACWRAGKSVHLVLKRRQRRRSIFIWTQSRGRTLIFWRTQKTMQSARPGIRVPQARGLEQRRLLIAVDHRERYPWKFPHRHAYTERRELPVGDYGIFFGNSLAAAVERKTITDLAGAVSSGTLRMQLAELSSLPRGILVVEGRLSDLVKAEKEAGVSAGWLLNLVAALQAEYPNVQWVFAETRGMAQDVAYRWLSAAVVILRGQIETQKSLDPGSGQPSEPEAPGGVSSSLPSGILAASGASIAAEGPAEWHAGASRRPNSSGAASAKPVWVGDRLGRQREALLLARQGHAWTIKSYQEHFQVSAATACQDLKHLTVRGDLVLAGPGRLRRYISPID